MIELTLDKAVALLNEVVAEKGEHYIYERDALGYCHYVDVDKPDCIVGHVLHRAGVPLRELSRHEGKNASTLLGALEEAGILQAAPQARILLDHVQVLQDKGEPWGEAGKCVYLYA